MNNAIHRGIRELRKYFIGKKNDVEAKSECFNDWWHTLRKGKWDSTIITCEFVKLADCVCVCANVSSDAKHILCWLATMCTYLSIAFFIAL